MEKRKLKNVTVVGKHYLPFLYPKRKTNIYSPSLIIVSKNLLVKAKIKAIMQYYDNLLLALIINGTLCSGDQTI